MNSIVVQSVAYHNHSEITANGDWALVELVTLANTANIEIGIVLNFSGVLLAGTLVGGTRYFSEMKAQVMLLGNTDSLLHTSLTKIAAMGQSTYDTIAAGGGVHPPQYLHLINAHFVSPTGEVGATSLSTWRGKISDVGGFHLHVATEIPGSCPPLQPTASLAAKD